jgi:hypothetical protein
MRPHTAEIRESRTTLDCPHLPPCAETRPPTTQDFTCTRHDGAIDPEDVHHYLCYKIQQTYEEGQRDAGWAGLRLAALCIGVGAYSGSLPPLETPARDATDLIRTLCENYLLLRKEPKRTKGGRQSGEETGRAKGGGVAGSRSTRGSQSGAVRSGRGEEGRVQRSHESHEEEENRVLKEMLEDVHAWPATAEQVAQVAEFNAINAMSALSLSHEGPGGGGGGWSRSEGEESKVFPLVVVRVLVLQVSCCLFKSMCRVCSAIGTDATRRAALQDGSRLAATQVGSDFRLYEVRLRGVN